MKGCKAVDFNTSKYFMSTNSELELLQREILCKQGACAGSNQANVHVRVQLSELRQQLWYQTRDAEPAVGYSQVILYRYLLCIVVFEMVFFEHTLPLQCLPVSIATTSAMPCFETILLERSVVAGSCTCTQCRCVHDVHTRAQTGTASIRIAVLWFPVD